MKRRSRFAALVLAMALTMGLTACSGSEKPSDTYKIGICQLTQHAALDESTQGFIDALNEALPGNVEFDTQNASNDLTLCSTILNQFIVDEVDLILANATPALQTAAAATVEIPILSTSVTEYSVALDLEDFDGLIGGNISGTSDLAPLDQQADMLQAWFPDAKNVALLYCSAEANSQYQVDTMEAELTKRGILCQYFPFTDSNDLFPTVDAAASFADVIFVPTDNTIAASAAIIDNRCRPDTVPVFGGDEAICAACGVAALSIDYYDLGYTTGEMAASILTGEANISEMPIRYAPCTAMYNPEICALLGLTPPDGYTAVTLP